MPGAAKALMASWKPLEGRPYIPNSARTPRVVQRQSRATWHAGPESWKVTKLFDSNPNSTQSTLPSNNPVINIHVSLRNPPLRLHKPFQLSFPQEAHPMLYLERLPHPTLTPFIHTYWYSCDPAAIHRHERILPNGRPQIVISLTRDFLTNANHPADPLQPQPAALFLGIYSHHQLIDTIDLTELIGISFHPGGTIPFFPDTTHTFTNRETSLEDLWGRAALNLRDDLRQSATPTEKFNLLDFALRHRFTESRAPRRIPTIDYALAKLQSSPAATTS